MFRKSKKLSCRHTLIENLTVYKKYQLLKYFIEMQSNIKIYEYKNSNLFEYLKLYIPI